MSLAYFSVEMSSSYTCKTSLYIKENNTFSCIFQIFPQHIIVLLIFVLVLWTYKHFQNYIVKFFNILLSDFFMTHLKDLCPSPKSCTLSSILSSRTFIFSFSIFRVRSFKRDRDLTPLTPQMVCPFPQYCYLKRFILFQLIWNFSIFGLLLFNNEQTW